MLNIIRTRKREQSKQGQDSQKRDQWIKGITAALFIGSGIVLGNISEHYKEVKDKEALAAALMIKQEEEALAAAQALSESLSDDKSESTEAEKTGNEENESLPDPYKPAPDKLNLAYFYPEDTDSEEIIDSYAGQVFQELMIMDLDWLANLYELSDVSPSTMASRLGKSTKAIMGSYNPRDKKHKANNPSSWIIHDWRKIHVNFINGDGKAVDGFSNVKDILSMASVYTYSTEMMDVDAFAEYSRQLWKNSHSYSLSMSDLYYCSGCLNKTEEELVREAEEDELAAENAFSAANGQPKNSGEREASQENTGTGMYTIEEGVGGFAARTTKETISSESRENENTEKMNGTAKIDEAETADEAAAGIEETETANETAEVKETEIGKESAETNSSANSSSVLGNSSGSVPASTPAAQEGGSSAFGRGSLGSGNVLHASPSDVSSLETNSPETGSDRDSNKEETLEDDEKKKEKKTQYDCPGHVDLYIRVKILGLTDNRGLFSITRAAEKKEWEGWTKENISYVKKISSQDWFDDYGLSVSSISLSTPLTNQEIDRYMNQLPADTSVTRRNIIHFALSSVGRVPYYWGGKAASSGYEGNHFGALIPADPKGRVLKGLDCSGWINWVYWSATGKRLAGESTSSLCLCGEQISRSELKPGDIIVRTGTGAHVVMFLSWNADGRMNVIHETSASINNVSVATMDAPWPYYRKLVP